ncbi:MAG: NADH-quinone oxidoreductase subunit H [Deltaproteobacteria bacterium]|nr:NADH-quinone oxidoreductase subunit H [Deltaproteobacteria bacterium]
MDSTWMIILLATVKWLALAFVFVMPVASILTWAERRQSAMMQDRLGPNRANIGRFRAWGLFHFLADALKMIFKEDFIPGRAHRFLFALGPILAMAPVMIALAIIPFGPTIYPSQLGRVLDPGNLPSGGEPLQVFKAEFGLVFYFAVASIANYGTALAGWASYNKWALLGGLRAASQMLSYEVAMGLAILGMFLVTGTLEPGAIVDWQGSNPLHWGFMVQPLALILFFTAAIAETKRTPFDLPEGESEIIGYFIEYSGMRFGMFYLAEFIEVIFASAILVTVFFGGYHVPALHVDGFHFGDFVLRMPHWGVVVLQLLAWGAKVLFFCWFQLLVRWSLPRFRPDKLLDLGWKKLLPISLANIMLTAAVVLWLER